MEKKLEKLLLQKPFANLTAEERYYATEFLDEAEYDRLHVFFKQTKQAAKQAPTLPPALKQNLLAAFRQSNGLAEAPKPMGRLRRLAHYRIPAWQAAAAVLLLIGVQVWLQPKPEVVEQRETVFVHKTDTVFQEVASPAVQKNKVPDKPLRLNTKPKLAPVDSLDEAFVSTNPIQGNKKVALEMADTFRLQVSQPRGRSASQSADLLKLLSEVY